MIVVHMPHSYPPIAEEIADEADPQRSLQMLAKDTLGDWYRLADRAIKQYGDLIVGVCDGIAINAYVPTGHKQQPNGTVRFEGVPATRYLDLIGAPAPGGPWKQGELRATRYLPTPDPGPPAAETEWIDKVFAVARAYTSPPSPAGETVPEEPGALTLGLDHQGRPVTWPLYLDHRAQTLIVTGRPASGKTHLATLLADQATNHHLPTYVLTEPLYPASCYTHPTRAQLVQPDALPDLTGDALLIIDTTRPQILGTDETDWLSATIPGRPAVWLMDDTPADAVRRLANTPDHIKRRWSGSAVAALDDHHSPSAERGPDPYTGTYRTRRFAIPATHHEA